MLVETIYLLIFGLEDLEGRIVNDADEGEDFLIVKFDFSLLWRLRGQLALLALWLIQLIRFLHSRFICAIFLFVYLA